LTSTHDGLLPLHTKQQFCVLVHVVPTAPPGVTHLHVPLTQVWPFVVQLSVQELHAVLVSSLTQVPLQQVFPPAQALRVLPHTQWPLRQASATLPLQEMQAVPKPLVPQVAVESEVRQVPLWQQPLRQVVLSQGCGVVVVVVVGSAVVVVVVVGAPVVVVVVVVAGTQVPLLQVPLQQVWPPGQQIWPHFC
jgi:hypothetical protein